MKTAFLFLATGFEETEAVATADVMIRGGINVKTVSITGNRSVTGAHGISVNTDLLFDATDFSKGDILVLPGGMPGADNLNKHQGLRELLLQYDRAGKLLAAICAAPLVFGGLGLLAGKRATAYPGFQNTLTGAEYQETGVVCDGNIITSRGPGFSFQFGLAIVEALIGKNEADALKKGLLL
ncbi:MAG: DJ-1/PfpI family protein [Dysgonamonadaceae bacterium]|jgi:4-methyl-5(b-hydroxyethyl)-thiazole monophosphate biosynthesis|nr:DJ-1/PfpI family protein [Dysgonamonadaceae bacterium]